MGRLRTANRRAKRRALWVGPTAIRPRHLGDGQSPALVRYLNRYGREWYGAKWSYLINPKTFAWVCKRDRGGRADG